MTTANSDLRKTFVTFYLESLNERTRQEKKGAKWGIDWVVYNLGLELFGKPVRLPFLRSASNNYSKTKTEPEFGVDLSFLSDDRKCLTIFVLKDEPLTYREWTDSGFAKDLNLAVSPDLDAEGLQDVSEVIIVLAYNKDDDLHGVEAFERFAKSAPPTIRGLIPLRFKRWNLSDLVDLTLMHLLSPALVPQKFFGQLSYLCAQAADFPHGSEPWEQQLIPSWKRLLEDILSEGAGEKGVALLPVALVILRQHAEENPSIQTGFIDLTEWTAIALWRNANASSDKDAYSAVLRFWIHFYVLELERFYSEQMPHLATKQSIDQVGGGDMVSTVAASYIGYWHLARLGLLSLAFSELLPSETSEEKRERAEAMNRVTKWIIELTNANVCLFRPLLDIHHIEIYLLTMALLQTGRPRDLTSFLENLVGRLYIRRFGKTSSFPFLDGHNSIENVFEQMATRPEESVVATSSSFFVLMLLELCCTLSPDDRDRLLTLIHSRLVLGPTDLGNLGENQALDLISWVAPADWEEKVLHGYVDDGEAVSLYPLADPQEAAAADLHAALKDVVTQMQKASKLALKGKVPLSALILASLRHRSPLPPELWREDPFPAYLS